jgi:hypothetical protein
LTDHPSTERHVAADPQGPVAADPQGRPLGGRSGGRGSERSSVTYTAGRGLLTATALPRARWTTPLIDRQGLFDTSCYGRVGAGGIGELGAGGPCFAVEHDVDVGPTAGPNDHLHLVVVTLQPHAKRLRHHDGFTDAHDRPRPGSGSITPGEGLDRRGAPPRHEDRAEPTGQSVEINQALHQAELVDCRPRSEALDAIGLWAAVALAHGVANPLALLQGRRAHHDRDVHEQVRSPRVRGDEAEPAIGVETRDDTLPATDRTIGRAAPAGRSVRDWRVPARADGAPDQVHIPSLRALVTANHLVGDAVTLRQRGQTVAQGPGVDEDVVTTGIGGDEPEALALVVPGDGAVATVAGGGPADAGGQRQQVLGLGAAVQIG